MYRLTDTEKITVIDRVLYAMDHADPEGAPRTILVQTYCKYMPYATEAQGQLMVQEIIDWMGRIQECFEETADNPDTYPEALLRQELECLTSLQKCQALTAMIGALRKFDSVAMEAYLSTPDNGSLLKHMEGSISPYSGENPDADWSGLLTQAASRFACDNISEATISRLAQAGAEGGNVAALSLRYKANENLFRAVSAVVIYSMAKTGQLQQAPTDLEPSHVVISLFCEDMAREINRDLNRHRLTQEQHRQKLQLLWKTVRMMLGMVVVSWAAVGVVSLSAANVHAAALGAALVVVKPCGDYINQIVEKHLTQISGRVAREDLELYRMQEEEAVLPVRETSEVPVQQEQKAELFEHLTAEADTD